MPIAPCLGLLLLVGLGDQQPVNASLPRTEPASISSTALPAQAPAARAAVPLTPLRAAHRVADDPEPRDKEGFAVPEAGTLLLVGGALVWLALAKRRLRAAPLTVPR